MVLGYNYSVAGLTLIELIVILASVLVSLKLILVWLKPPELSKFVQKLFTKKWFSYIVLYLFLYLAWLLLNEITVVQFAFAFFTFGLLLMYTAMRFPKEAQKFVKSALSNRRRLWAVYLIVIIVILRALSIIFFG